VRLTPKLLSAGPPRAPAIASCHRARQSGRIGARRRPGRAPRAGEARLDQVAVEFIHLDERRATVGAIGAADDGGVGGRAARHTTSAASRSCARAKSPVASAAASGACTLV